MMCCTPLSEPRGPKSPEDAQAPLHLPSREMESGRQHQESWAYGTIRTSHLSLLQQAESYQATVHHPCWPTGYHKSLSLSSIYDSPCTEKERPSLDLDTTITVVGTGNGSLCALLVSKLFDFTTCSFSRCSFDGVFQPEVSGNFIVSLGTEQGGGKAARWASVPKPPATTQWQSQTPSSARAGACAHHASQSSCSWGEGLLPACLTTASFPLSGLLCLLLHGRLHPDSDGETCAFAQ